MEKGHHGTYRLLKKYVDWENEQGRSVTVVKCHGYSSSKPSKPSSVDELQAERIPVHISHETVRTCLHNLGYNDEGSERISPNGGPKRASASE